jgi:hypothetical protein
MTASGLKVRATALLGGWLNAQKLIQEPPFRRHGQGDCAFGAHDRDARLSMSINAGVHSIRSKEMIELGTARKMPGVGLTGVSRLVQAILDVQIEHPAVPANIYRGERRTRNGE